MLRADQTDVFILAPKDTEATQLSDTGRLFKKQLVPFGDWVDPLNPEGRMVFIMDTCRAAGGDLAAKKAFYAAAFGWGFVE